MQDIEQLAQEISDALEKAQDESSIESIKIAYLGKKGTLTLLLKQLGSLPSDERAAMGGRLNDIKVHTQQALTAKSQQLAQAKLNASLLNDTTDISLPNYGVRYGSWHPVSRMRRRLEDIFRQAGYETVVGPEMESDYYNFQALNFPPLHPARTLHDTFYFGDGQLLRTHTSTGQIRAMETRQPPIRIICPGKTYRCDYDATHTPMFHQVEGMLIDKDISFTDLKGTLQGFINAFFGREIKLRFRASYFPFTEPSAEVDILWQDGKDEGEKWLEILGCGMVHPNVLKHGGIDPDKYSGFAFGLGIERMAMLYYGINDLRSFYENDLRFLQQFV